MSSSPRAATANRQHRANAESAGNQDFQQHTQRERHTRHIMLAATAAAAAGRARSAAAAAAACSGWGPAWQLARRAYAADAGGSAVTEVQSMADYDGIMQQLRASGSLGIIDFTAKWCGPCKAVAPIYEQLSQQYPEVRFLKVDIDNEDLAGVVADHGITGVPTFTMYKGDRKVENFTGARVDLLKALLQKHAS